MDDCYVQSQKQLTIARVNEQDAQTEALFQEFSPIELNNAAQPQANSTTDNPLVTLPNTEQTNRFEADEDTSDPVQKFIRDTTLPLSPSLLNTLEHKSVGKRNDKAKKNGTPQQGAMQERRNLRLEKSGKNNKPVMTMAQELIAKKVGHCPT